MLLLDETVTGVDELRSWVARINTLSKIIFETQNELDEVSMRRHFAVVEQNVKLQLKLDGEARRLSHKLDTMMNFMRELTQCSNMDELQELMTDVKVRVANAYELHENWRRYLAYVELAESLSEFPKDVSRDDCHLTARGMQTEFELQMALIRKLIAARKALT